eukprot:g4206.t1
MADIFGQQGVEEAGESVTSTVSVQVAATDGDLDIVQLHVSESGLACLYSPDENGYTAIHAASGNGHTELLAWIIQKISTLSENDQHAAINARDSDQDTPLHSCEHIACLQLLLEAGADHTLVNNEGQTPLQLYRNSLEELRGEGQTLQQMSSSSTDTGGTVDNGDADDSSFLHFLDTDQQSEYHQLKQMIVFMEDISGTDTGILDRAVSSEQVPKSPSKS